MRVMLLPHDFDAGTDGVSENQIGPRLGDAEPILPEEDRGVLPRPRGIIAPDADHCIQRDGGDELVDLGGEGLLQADKVSVLFADDVEEHLATRGPVVLAVLRGAIADVEGHHGQRLARRGLCGDLCQIDRKRGGRQHAKEEHRHGAAG
jgi:hypothetical protein